MDIFKSLWDSFGQGISSLLPTSPFSQFIDKFSNIPYLGYLNWFIPISSILIIFNVYLIAVGSYYFYSIVLRWLRALE